MGGGGGGAVGRSLGWILTWMGLTGSDLAGSGADRIRGTKRVSLE